MQHLWNSSAGCFYNKDSGTNASIERVTPNQFYPLLAGKRGVGGVSAVIHTSFVCALRAVGSPRINSIGETRAPCCGSSSCDGVSLQSCSALIPLLFLVGGSAGLSDAPEQDGSVA